MAEIRSEKSGQLSALLLVIVAEAVAVWSVLYVKNRILPFVLILVAAWFANRYFEMLGRRLKWTDLWWSWPLIVLTAFGVILFVAVVAGLVGLL